MALQGLVKSLFVHLLSNCLFVRQAFRFKLRSFCTLDTLFTVFFGSCLAIHAYRLFSMEHYDEPTSLPLGNGDYFSLHALVCLVTANLFMKYCLKLRAYWHLNLLVIPSFCGYLLANHAYAMNDIYSNHGENEWVVVAFRALCWPLISELLTAPVRLIMREADPENVDKEGMALYLVPVMSTTGLLGAVILFSLKNFGPMLVCNAALVIVEGIRLGRMHERDKFYVRIIYACCPRRRDAVLERFQDRSSRKCRCLVEILQNMISFNLRVFTLVFMAVTRFSRHP